jgi:hypothetical protein
MTMPIRLRSGIALFILIAAAAVLGMLTYQDYGVGWDEPEQRKLGKFTYEYVAHGDSALLSYIHRDYGPALEWLLANLERMLHTKSFRDAYLLRHLATHFFFLAGAAFIFLIVHKVWKNTILATTGFILYVCCPLLYGHSFINSKDVPFMSLFPVCMYLLILGLRSRKWWHYAVAGAFSGALIDIRIMGVIVPAIGLFTLLLSLVSRKGIGYKRDILNAIIYLSATTAFVYLLWPNLWRAPIANFREAFAAMSHFRWVNYVRFMGQDLESDKLPWYYIPVWFCITLPIPMLLLGFSGAALAFTAIVKSAIKRAFTFTDLLAVMSVLVFFLPVVAVIMLDSVLYDGWRQLFFIYPGFILLCVNAVARMEGRLRRIAFSLAGLSVAVSLVFLVCWHPFGHVYFNSLANPYRTDQIRKNFELDYWGLSYKQAIDAVLARVPDTGAVSIASQNPPFDLNVMMLPDAARARIKISVIPESDFFVTNFRWHAGDYTEKPFNNRLWGKVSVGNNMINGIYRLK